MKNYLFLFMFIICASFKAQKVIVKLDSVTGGRLVIDTDEEIGKMIDENELCKKISATTSASTSSAGTPSSGKSPTRPATPKNICGKRNDIPGFMIKVGEAKSEQEINTMMLKFRTEFPELRVEKSYLRPDWRLLAGDYFKRESGQADLRRVKKSFPTAMLINWRIYCNRAK
jgi:hypothetical protein